MAEKKRLEVHEAASMFPMLDPKRLGELALDIEANGLREPITLFDGKILDGRNRYEACELAQVAPRFREFDGGDPFAWVWSLNGQRRDLTADQRAAIWLEVNDRSESWQAIQTKIREEANKKRSEASKGNDNAVKRQPTGKTVDEQVVHPPFSQPKIAVEREAAAKESGTNKGAIQRQKQLREQRPDLAEKVRSGEIKPTQAMREMKRDQLGDKVAALPSGQYRVIYADPPWQYGDERVGLTGYTAAETHYPTMSKSDICALGVSALRAPDCVLFLWATFPLLPDALEVVAAWGFRYKTSFVWDKQRQNIGNYHNACAELLIVATRGSCIPDGDTQRAQIQRIPKGKHSAKPEQWRELIDALYREGPRIELFRRGDAPGRWVVWGNEAIAA